MLFVSIHRLLRGMAIQYVGDELHTDYITETHNARYFVCMSVRYNFVYGEPRCLVDSSALLRQPSESQVKAWKT